MTALVTMLTCWLVALSTTSAEATFAGRNGLVLFNRGGDLFTANASGDDVQRLTRSGRISGGTWSPDGRRIAYREGGQIRVLNLDSGYDMGLATGATSGPRWSPDGSRIAYLAELPDAPCGEEAVYTVPSRGGTGRLAFDPGSDNCPNTAERLSLGSFLPDGTSILLTSCKAWRDSYCDISAVGVDGLGAVREVLEIACSDENSSPEDAEDIRCEWAMNMSAAEIGPGGARVLFSGRGGYEAPVGTLPGSTALPTWETPERLYRVDLSGRNLQRVSTAQKALDPTWSPNGARTLFTKPTAEGSNVMTLQGTDTGAVASLLIRNASEPDWQPIPR